MGFILLIISMLAINVGIDLLRRRNERSLGHALESEYQKAKFIPTSILLPLVAIGIVLAGVSGNFAGVMPLLGLIFPVFLAAVFIFLRISKERKLRTAGLPRGFLGRDRAYSLMTALVVVTWAALLSFAR